MIECLLSNDGPTSSQSCSRASTQGPEDLEIVKGPDDSEETEVIDWEEETNDDDMRCSPCVEDAWSFLRGLPQRLSQPSAFAA